MASKEEKQEVNNIQLVTSNKPTSATDMFNVGHREDGFILLRLVSALPDNICVENHRTLIGKECATGLIDTLCSLTDYYPTKPKAKPKTKTKTKTKKKGE
ncbi:hypothetical protein ACFL5J_01040 [Thermodesulfobacteriota bacterium]